MYNREIEESDYYINMNRVLDLYLKGEVNASVIAKSLGMKRVDVLDYIQSWKELAKNNPAVKDRASEVLQSFDRSTDMVIKGLWAVHDETLDLKVKADALKKIHDVDSKRQETLQKAGLYDDAGISEELVKMEEYVEGIRSVLFAVIKNYPETKTFIMEQFSRMGDPVSVDNPAKEITQ